MSDSKSVVHTYEKMASIYDWIYRGYLEGTMKVALDILRPDGRERILDLACGTGELERRVMKVHPAQAIVGVDLTEAMLSRARQKLAAFPHVVFFHADGSKLPFESESFDCVITCSAFHYMRQPEAVLKEAARVLPSGGRFVLIDWTRDHWQGRLYDWFHSKTKKSHYKVYSSPQMKSLCKNAGLNVQEVRIFNVMGWWTMQAIVAHKS